MNDEFKEQYLTAKWAAVQRHLALVAIKSVINAPIIFDDVNVEITPSEKHLMRLEAIDRIASVALKGKQTR